VKAILSGAAIVQVVSALLERGVDYLSELRRDTELWFDEHDYESLDAVRGRMSLLRAPNPKALERMNYIYNLDSWYGAVPHPATREPQSVPSTKHP
jgi:dihydroorotate dehydrogenase (fumarate)